MVHDDVYLCLYVCSAAGSEAPQERGSYDGQANYSNSTYTCPSLYPVLEVGGGLVSILDLLFWRETDRERQAQKVQSAEAFLAGERSHFKFHVVAPTKTTNNQLWYNQASKKKQDQAQTTTLSIDRYW